MYVVALLLLERLHGDIVERADEPQSMIPAESWFPSPRGGALKEWAADNQKAELLVGNMTLIEKVNITTGTGWQMGLCVGNTGMFLYVLVCAKQLLTHT